MRITKLVPVALGVYSLDIQVPILPDDPSILEIQTAIDKYIPNGIRRRDTGTIQVADLSAEDAIKIYSRIKEVVIHYYTQSP